MQQDKYIAYTELMHPKKYYISCSKVSVFTYYRKQVMDVCRPGLQFKHINIINAADVNIVKD